MSVETTTRDPLVPARRTRRARRERTRVFAVTREGRIFVLVTLGVGLAAVNTGNNLLYLILGLLLSMLLTSGVLSDLVLWGLRVRRLSNPRLFAGSPAYFELEVTNTKSRLASLSFELIDIAHGERESPSGHVLKLAPGATTTVLVARSAEARGVLDLHEIHVRTRYPFGIIEKTRRFKVETSVVVYPRLVDVALAEEDPRRVGHESPARGRGATGDVIGFRDFVDGEAARDIHWRKSATLARSVVRERSREADPELALHLDTRVEPASTEAKDRFEGDVSRVASLALLATSRGRGVVVSSHRGELARADGPADVDRLLTVLALVSPEPSPGDA